MRSFLMESLDLVFKARGLPSSALARNRDVIGARIIVQWRNWATRCSGPGPQFRSAEIHCARSADPLIAHDFEAQSLAPIQAGQSRAFEGAYTDQHINSAVVGLEETIALRDVEPSDGSNCHSASSHG
jgi:hypothetical protein